MPTPETETDYYTLLGVDPGAEAVTIRQAVVGAQRRWGARQNSPDLAARQEAERYAQLLLEVRDVLLDPGRRALYDVRRIEAMPTRHVLLPAIPPRRLFRPAWYGPIAALALTVVVSVVLATRPSTTPLPAGSVAPAAMPTRVPVETPVPIATIEDAAASAAAPLPTASAALAEPAASPPAVAVLGHVFVADTDGEGVFLSSTPNRGDRLTAWPDGSQLDIVGDDVTGDGLTWASVRAADGQVGFVPRQYISNNRPPQRVAPTAAPTRRALPDDVPVTLSGMPLSTSIIPPPNPPLALAGGRYILSWSVAGRQPCDFVITIADPITPALARTTLSNRIQNRADGQPAQGQTSVNLNGGKYRLEAYSDTCTWSLTLQAG